MKQLVSILIPAYNAEMWISGCIESALAQTWPRKEIIVVNDGSKDSTLKVAKSYASRHVHVTTQENRGASAARNHALSLAQGDYIQWLDADDLLSPDKITIQLEGAEPGHSSQVLLSSSWGKFYYRPENSKFIPDALWQDLTPSEWLFRKMDQNLWMAIESWLVSRRLTDMAGPWNETMSLDDDGEYFCRVLSCASMVRFMDQAQCYCRRATFGLSHDLTLSNKKLESLAYSLFSYIQTMRSMDTSHRSNDACLKLLNRWAIYFYPERPDLFNRLQSTAEDLGGHVAPPKLRTKYQWIQKIFGWRIAKKAQHELPALRTIVERSWERLFISSATCKNK